jgi:hypothetical protein
MDWFSRLIGRWAAAPTIQRELVRKRGRPIVSA